MARKILLAPIYLAAAAWFGFWMVVGDVLAYFADGEE